MLRRKSSHDPTFGEYQHDTDGSLKFGTSSFKYNDKHVFVDGKECKATQGLLELQSLNLMVSKGTINPPV